MKKILKILMWFVIVVLLLIVLLTVVAKLSENRIAKKVMSVVGETIDAPVDISSVSFNLLRKFPNATIQLNGIYLGTPVDSLNPDKVSDTIANIDKIYVAVRSKALLKNRFEILKIEVKGAKINYLVDTAGATNIDFLIPTDTLPQEEVVEDTVASAPLDLTLKELILEDIVCNYNDSSLKASAQVTIPKFKLKAKVKGEDIKASVKGGLVLNNCSFDTTNLFLMKRTSVDFDVDYMNDSVTINDLVLATDGANISALGSVILRNDIYTDMQVNINKLLLNELIKYAPESMLNEFGLNKVAGNISVQAKIKGTYSDSTKQMPKVDLDFSMKDGFVRTKDYPTIRKLSFSGQVSNGVLQNNQSTSAQIKDFHFEIGESKFNINASVLDIDKPKYDIKTNMKVNVNDFMQFVPDTLRPGLSGIVNLQMATKGQIPNEFNDAFIDNVIDNSLLNMRLSNFNAHIDKTMSVKNFGVNVAYKEKVLRISGLNIIIPEYKAVLRNTSLTAKMLGKYSKPNSLGVDLQRFKINTDSSSISGKAVLKSLLKNPTVNANTKLKINLAEMATFAPDTLLDHLSGQVNVDIKLSDEIYLDSIEKQMNEILFTKLGINILMKNINVDLANDSLVVLNNFGGKIDFSPEQLAINNLGGNFNGIDFEIDSTIITNVYETIIQESRDTSIVVETKINIGEINNAFLALFMPADSVASDSAEVKLEQTDNIAEKTNPEANVAIDTTNEGTALLPNFAELGVPHFLVRGTFSINKVEYGKNIIDDISMKFRFVDSLYVIDQFKLKTCGGDMNTSLMLDVRKWIKPKVDIKNTIANLDLKQLLINNDNFGDSTLTSDNLSGILTSELHARAFYINGDWPTENIRVKGDFMLENGKIYDFEPLVNASVGIGGLKELDKMDFNTLKTSIFMFKDKIYVPKTDVVSNALDLSAFAMHGMTDEIGYEYHLVLHLGDVFKGKSDKLMEKQAKQNKKDGGTVDRNGLNLVSMDVAGKKKNGLDNDKLKKQFETKLQRQYNIINSLFDPRLVNYSTDFDRTNFIKLQLERKE